MSLALVVSGVAVAGMSMGGELSTEGRIAPSSDTGGALAPLAMEALPLGSVKPEGWLKCQLDKMTEGLVGRLYETSEFLREDNAWLKGIGSVGWEEQPYWLRSFIKLAVLTGNARCLDVSQKWVEGVLSTAETDGWFGPKRLKAYTGKDGRVISDIWPHMVMAEALLSWYDFTGDRRIPNVLTAFARYCLKLDSGRFLTNDAKGGDWHFTVQGDRAMDWVPTLHRLYGITGDRVFLDLAERSYIRRRRVYRTFLDNHTVNFAERFAYETYFVRQSRSDAHRKSAEYWYDLHMKGWGSEMPRGAFAADECARVGCRDPRYGTESCTWGEFVRSFSNLGRITGSAVYADRTEDVVFNHFPVAYTPDYRRVHYITAPNQVNLDAATDHNYFNRAPQVAYSDKLYRCCRHNAAQTLPLFAENLVQRTSGGDLVFWMYAPHSGSMKGEDGMRWTMDTRYPFRERVTLTLSGIGTHDVFLRIPRWAKGFSVKRGAFDGRTGENGMFVRLKGPWKPVETVEITMGMETVFTRYPRTQAVSVDRGPLTYSLAIKELYGECVQPTFSYSADLVAQIKFPEDAGGVATKMTEVRPGSDWNYALDVSAMPEYRECAWTDNCFVATNAPCEMMVVGRRLKEWTLQDHQPAALQESPVYVTSLAEKLRFIPLGCARLRLSVLPVASDDPHATRWETVPETTRRTERPRIFSY